VYGLDQLSSGKIVVAGDFTEFNNVSRDSVARLNLEGSLDEAFIPPTVNGPIYGVAVQPDEKVIIAGDFTTIGTNSRPRIARLNADGSLDTSFDPTAGANGPIFSIALQPNGKVILGGAFVSVNNTNRGRIARLNSDGSLDLAFDPGLGADNTIYAVKLLPDGGIMIGGSFTMVNGFARKGIARLNGDEPVIRVAAGSYSGGQFTLLVSSLPGRRYAVEASSTFSVWTVLGTNTATENTLPFTDTNASNFVNRFYRARKVNP
jgi:uncharacterized delta-60 repeat protein